jgi:hypothetical protein
MTAEDRGEVRIYRQGRLTTAVLRLVQQCKRYATGIAAFIAVPEEAVLYLPVWYRRCS